MLRQYATIAMVLMTLAVGCTSSDEGAVTDRSVGEISICCVSGTVAVGGGEFLVQGGGIRGFAPGELVGETFALEHATKGDDWVVSNPVVLSPNKRFAAVRDGVTMVWDLDGRSDPTVVTAPSERSVGPVVAVGPTEVTTRTRDGEALLRLDWRTSQVTSALAIDPALRQLKALGNGTTLVAVASGPDGSTPVVLNERNGRVTTQSLRGPFPYQGSIQQLAVDDRALLVATDQKLIFFAHTGAVAKELGAPHDGPFTYDAEQFSRRLVVVVRPTSGDNFLAVYDLDAPADEPLILTVDRDRIDRLPQHVESAANGDVLLINVAVPQWTIERWTVADLVDSYR